MTHDQTPHETPDETPQAPRPLGQGSGAGEGLESLEVPFAPVDFTSREWAAPWMGEFLNLMATMPVASSAARQVGVGRATAYRWRDRDEEFRAAWDEAYERGVDVALHATWRWGVTGIEWTETETREETDANGQVKVVRVSRTHRDRNAQIAMMLLKAHRPEYRDQARLEHTGAGGGPVVHVVERLPTRERMLELAAIARDLEIESGLPPVSVEGDVEAA